MVAVAAVAAAKVDVGKRLLVALAAQDPAAEVRRAAVNSMAYDAGEATRDGRRMRRAVAVAADRIARTE